MVERRADNTLIGVRFSIGAAKKIFLNTSFFVKLYLSKQLRTNSGILALAEEPRLTGAPPYWFRKMLLHENVGVHACSTI